MQVPVLRVGVDDCRLVSVLLVGVDGCMQVFLVGVDGCRLVLALWKEGGGCKLALALLLVLLLWNLGPGIQSQQTVFTLWAGLYLFCNNQTEKTNAGGANNICMVL